MMTKSLLRRLRKDKKALTPAISTTILTSAIIVMLLVTINFANNYLNARIAENEFNAMKQFMQNLGEQIDSVAWIPGQTETIRFASKFGHISFQPVFLNYSIYLGGSPSANFSYLTRILLYNMPINSYNIADNYYERLSPPSTDSFLQAGPSALVSRTYIIEKLSMNGGSFLRIAVVPCIRTINTTTSTGESTTQNYTRFFLPILSPGIQTGSSQSVTLGGSQVSRETGTANNVKIVVSFPNATMGFNEDFFRFSSQNETVTVEPDSIVEFHTSRVIVSIGLYD